MARQIVDKTTPEYQLQQIAGARSTLLLALVLTLVNIVMILVNSNTMFLFSIFVPYVGVVFGRTYDAGLFGTNTITALVIAAVIVGVFFVCWLLSKKNHRLLTLAAILFALDTAALLFFMFTISNDPAGQIMDIVLHAVVLVQLIQGVIASGKLKKLAQENDEAAPSCSPEF